jgi:Na+/H+ antiporter NhaD/arsenite permease-like protein
MKKQLFLAISSVALLAVFISFSDFYIDFIGNTQTLLTDISSGGEGGEHGAVPTWLIIPFVILLGMIATGPLFYEHIWHKNYPIISVVLATVVVLFYVFVQHNVHSPVHAAFEYIQFIALIGSLYVASGGILIEIDRKGKTSLNIIILVIGAVLANIIGTTGASMLLIRPFMRLNKERIQAYHVIFFIFIISNVGGSLTPIGDPPLFLGFLKGVPFEWTLTHNFLPWVFAVSLLCGIFYVFERRNSGSNQVFAMGSSEDEVKYTNKITFVGNRNFVWLGVIILAVFIDPSVFDWVPGIMYEGQKFSFIREIILFLVIIFSFRFANKNALAKNEFNFAPIKEVGFVFIGIFGTMIPALELVAEFAKSPEGAALITHNTLYWGTGLLSGFLDNAPTYLNFLTAALAAQGGEIGTPTDVINFANGAGAYTDSVLQLTSISVSAVFFGAMTYIGNGPNFMVKSIAEQVGIQMPTFFGYLLRYSIPFLLPVLLLVWLIFFFF